MAASSSLFLFLFFFFFQFVINVNGAAKVVPSGPISKVEDAVYFQMYYGQSFKVIKNSIDGKSYLLMQNTSRMALKTKYCTGRIKSFVIPLSNYSVDTTTVPVSFFEMLGLVGYLKGLTSDIVTSECVLMSYANGGILLLNTTDTQQFTQLTAHFIGNVDEERACNFAAFMPFEETTPLRRAEWIKYLGSFTNSESRANTVYDAIKGNYLCLSKVAANLTTRFKPVVAWIDYNQGIWSFAKETYKLQYVVDAGGENLDDSISNNSYNNSIPDEIDNFRAILCTVDVAIDQTYSEDPAEYTLSTFLENIGVEGSYCFGFVTNQSLWRYDKRAGNFSSLDWFDGAVSQPQLVLADLIEAFFPTGNYNTTYFRNLAKGEGVITVSPDMCQRNTSTPMEPTIVPCQ
ncbi:Helical backbone' metal receptor domain-containing protein [Dioscorea alata]|uniref:Helical backbone' metal receptor domain-containing protein n=3 Tax=Dioscorea alata TaxID=55571 RepID=A0ACB7UV66_DIOAL|nr:Helical backbone' metal receptor domain-containing protein [Dioscorea alata]